MKETHFFKEIMNLVNLSNSSDLFNYNSKNKIILVIPNFTYIYSYLKN